MSTKMAVAGVSTVAVTGGELTIEVSTGSSEPVLAIHGLSSQRKLWSWLRAADPELTLIAPDLRGRGDSVAVEGPSSLHRHAADLVAVLDVLELDSAAVLGMSMGAFVAVELAALAPDRVRSLVLIDGGYPMAPPPGLSADQIPAMFADRLGRLTHPWASLDDYADYFVSATAPLVDRDDPLLLRYLEHDLRDGRVRLDPTTVVSDATDVFLGDSSWPDVRQPVRFLHAEWSSGAQTAPAYTAEDAAVVGRRAETMVFLPGHDHAGTVMTATGAAATARLVREALA